MIELITDAYDPVRPFPGWIILAVLIFTSLSITVLLALKGKFPKAKWRLEALGSIGIVGPLVAFFGTFAFFVGTTHFDFDVLKEDLESVGFEGVNMVTGSDSRTVDNRFTGMQKRTFVECVITEEVVKGTYEVWCEPVK